MFDFFWTSVSLFWPAGLACFVASVLLVISKSKHLHFTARAFAGSAVQCTHLNPIPRVGGVGLMLGLVATLFIVPNVLPSTETDSLSMMRWIIVAALPVFLAGLAEDVGIGASPKVRLMGAMVSGALMIWFTGQTIHSVGIPILDPVMGFLPVSILFTVFATAGVSHSFNLVDGLNGLAIGISLVAATALALIAQSTNDILVAYLAGAVVIVVVGLLAVNYPFGSLFLGDAGAYTLGHVIAWIAVLLMARNPEISPWAVLLAVFWPIMDTLAAILRRTVNKAPADAPDKMHFHHVVLRVIQRKLGRGHSLSFANPLATAFMFPLFLIPSFLAVIAPSNNVLGFIFFMLCALGYSASRAGMIRKFRRLTRARRQ